ncbi:MAG TPA: SDR family NAD(P)-dependent oxidoreductase [Kofleriaceae bacterium]|jgi:NAD(P)-dependent dehydrogenase (short-subunit alcohol dehydrogenase family)|nr:SDR family NAD(P)-dependent oxidoreductase [Kofleriaceae bacterium]
MARVVLITGSTDGIGRAAARVLAAAGMHVIVHGRSKVKVDAALAQLRDELPGGTLDGVAFDLSTLAGVRRGAAAVLEVAPELHVLVNNAGVFATERVVTTDKLELSFAVNYVAPFALTELLIPRLEASAEAAGVPSRVIDIASIAHTRGRIHEDDLQLARAFTGYAAYAQSKLAIVMHAVSLAERHDPDKLVAYAMHPGVTATKLLRTGFGPVQGASVEHGGRAIAQLAGGERTDEPSGSYFSDGIATPASSAARDAAVRERLWRETITLAKL